MNGEVERGLMPSKAPPVPTDYLFFLYRQRMRLSWSDLTGEWPQPTWRTHQDIWYLGIQQEAEAVVAARRAQRRFQAAPPHTHR